MKTDFNSVEKAFNYALNNKEHDHSSKKVLGEITSISKSLIDIGFEISTCVVENAGEVNRLRMLARIFDKEKNVKAYLEYTIMFYVDLYSLITFRVNAIDDSYEAMKLVDKHNVRYAGYSHNEVDEIKDAIETYKMFTEVISG